MSVKLLTEHQLEFLTLKVGHRGLSEYTLVKFLHCWKSHVKALLLTKSKMIMLLVHLAEIQISLGNILIFIQWNTNIRLRDNNFIQVNRQKW